MPYGPMIIVTDFFLFYDLPHNTTALGSAHPCVFWLMTGETLPKLDGKRNRMKLLVLGCLIIPKTRFRMAQLSYNVIPYTILMLNQ